MLLGLSPLLTSATAPFLGFEKNAGVPGTFCSRSALGNRRRFRSYLEKIHDRAHNCSSRPALSAKLAVCSDSCNTLIKVPDKQVTCTLNPSKISYQNTVCNGNAGCAAGPPQPRAEHCTQLETKIKLRLLLTGRGKYV